MKLLYVLELCIKLLTRTSGVFYKEYTEFYVGKTAGYSIPML